MFSNLIRSDRETGRSVERLKTVINQRTLSDVYGVFDNLPGLRGLWTAASVDQAGAMYDRSGQGRTLTYTGNPTLNLYNNLVPYWDYDGTGDYHARVDEAGLDVLGTETSIVAALRGMTMGGWFWFDRLANAEALISKLGAAGQFSHQLIVQADNTFRALVSGDGTATVTVASTVTHTIDQWYFVIQRFDPSTSLEVIVNGVAAINTTSIPASIFGSTAPFNIAGQNSGSALLDGRCALAFLCGTVLPDELIQHLFHSSQVVFDV